ncbi:MAG: DIP1984 family protein [Solobacterium sp.]|nr:DIP1984 family protein [Solobacterium sp.]
MKLAEALQLRADMNRRIEQIVNRLSNNSLHQEGEKPLEDPAVLLKELNETLGELQKMISKINLTNCKTILDGVTMTEKIAERDCLQKKIGIYRTFINEASQGTRRARMSEIRILPSVNVSDLQKQADQLSKELRLLDNRIQETNWKTELIEK